MSPNKYKSITLNSSIIAADTLKESVNIKDMVKVKAQGSVHL